MKIFTLVSCVFLSVLFFLLGVKNLFLKSKIDILIKKKCLVKRAKIFSGEFFLYILDKKYYFECKKRLESNTLKLFKDVNTSLLEKCNVDFTKPIFKIELKEFTINQKAQLLSLRKLSFENEFLLVVFLSKIEIRKKIENFLLNLRLKNVKVFLESDINSNLLFEINKLNINYPGDCEKVREGIFVDGKKVENYKFKNLFFRSEEIRSECEIVSSKILFPKQDENILTFSNFNLYVDANLKFAKSKKHEIEFCLQLEDDVLNIKREKEKIEVCYLNLKKQFFNFSDKNFDFCIKKYKKKCFLIVFFNFFAKINQTYSISCIRSDYKFENIFGELKQFKLNLFCSLNKFFNVEFQNLTCNNLNYEIKKSFIKCVFNDICINKKCTSFDYFFNLKKNKLGEYYLSFLHDILGLHLSNGILNIEKLLKANFTFSLTFVFVGEIFTIKKQKNFSNKIIIDNIEYVNLKEIDLKKVNGKKEIYCC